MTTTPARVRPRFLAPDLDLSSAQARLPPDESRHLTRVLRLTHGALVGVFDGRGHEFIARVLDARDAAVTLELLEPVPPRPESAVPFVLVQAALKGGAMDDVVRDATMMGAAAIQPVATRHATTKSGAAIRPEHVQRWRRIAVASAKQSRRARIPDVREPLLLEAALSVDPSALLLMFVEPSAGRATSSMRALFGSAPPSRAALVVGPEGGWAPAELDLAERSGASLITLGQLTLRAEAVPMAAMAIFSVLWE